MATRDDIYAAIKNADAAGDTDSVQKLGAYLKTMPADAPAAAAAPAPAPEQSFGDKALSVTKAMLGNSEGLKNFVGKDALMGMVRGAAGIGATIEQPFQYVSDKLTGKTAPTLSGLVTGQQPKSSNQEMREGIDGGVLATGANPDSLSFKTGKTLSEIAGTSGVGGLLAKPVAAAVPYIETVAPAVAQYVQRGANALASGGFSTGATPTNLLQRAGDMAIRMGGGAVNGAASTGLIDPNSTGTGAIVGGLVPPAMKIAGTVVAPVGRAIGAGIRAVTTPRDVAGAQALVKALDLQPDQLAHLTQQARDTPNDIVPGSNLTFSQVLQLAGQNTPAVKMLERTVAGGPGGDVLLQRYENQNTARLAALQAQGAQTYQGAAKEEATRAGDRIGAVVRTQATDDQAAARQAWENLHGRAADEGVALQLPLDQMNASMGPLGRGSVGVGRDANNVLNTAHEIGTAVPYDPLQGAGAAGGQTAPRAVPFDEFQRLRRDSGALGARAAEDSSRGAESRVLYSFEQAMADRADAAARGQLLPGEVMPEGFGQQYNAARDMTRTNAQLYGQGNNIGSILRRPVGQDYSLTGDEITNKLWHGGAGLAGDVSNLRNMLSSNNQEPVMNALRGHVMTDAASRVTASGQLASAFPKYVENRMPGLQEAMAPEQLNALSSVASDIRNSEAAAAIPGLRGSDTQAKISRALDAGLLDSPIMKTVAKFASIKGIGLETARNKVADLVVQNKGKAIADLLADPRRAAEALDALVRYQGPATNALSSETAARAVYRGAARSSQTGNR